MTSFMTTSVGKYGNWSRLYADLVVGGLSRENGYIDEIASARKIKLQNYVEYEDTAQK